MARSCFVCGKQAQYGNKISHAHNVTKRKFDPNLHSVRAVIDGVTRRIRVCTRCIRSGKIQKPALA
ncbi:MAG: 50S ribosomal protein L28 [Acidobacteria bacterium]|nr:50S ribosomal protein L28 [Acidobacteriota bacterium]